MASTAISQQPDGAAAPILKTSIPKRTTSQSHGINPKSKLELSKPLTRKTQRIIINETEQLIKKRNKLDQVLHGREVKRSKNGLKPNDWLLRQAVLKLSDALARREAKHIRLQNKLIRQRRNMYKWDPSPEREVDLELLQALQWKFKRNLSTHLIGRLRHVRPSQSDSDTSMDTFDGSEYGDNQDELMSKPDTDLSSSSETPDPEKDGSRTYTLTVEGVPSQSISSLDGAFDDYARARPKKQKVVANGSSELGAKKVRQNQGKKEQTANKHQTAISGSQPRQPSRSGSDSQEEEAKHAGHISAVESMFQSLKKPEVHSKEATTKAEKPDVSAYAASSASNDATPLNEANGKVVETKATLVQSSAVKTSGVQREPLAEPWYKCYAKAMMEPDFDDLVYDRPNRKRKRPRTDYYVHGALTEPRDVVRTGRPLPSPPSSSPGLSPSFSTRRKTKKVEKSQGRANRRKDKAQQGKARNSYHHSVSEPSVPNSRASGLSTAVSSTQKAPRSAQRRPSDALSAS